VADEALAVAAVEAAAVVAAARPVV